MAHRQPYECHGGFQQALLLLMPGDRELYVCIGTSEAPMYVCDCRAAGC